MSAPIRFAKTLDESPRGQKTYHEFNNNIFYKLQQVD